MSTVLYGVDDVTGVKEAVQISQQTLHVAQYVWDTNTLEWVRQTGGGSSPGTDVTVTNFPATQAVSLTGNSTATVSNVTATISSTTLKSANASRKGLSVFNDSSADLYLKLGATASSSSYTVKMVAGSYYELPYQYTGVVDGVWASATGSARVTEIS